MRSSPTGANISSSEVTNVEPMGFWVLVDDKEYFVPYADYPAFKSATVEQIFNLKTQAPGQLYWPELDIDIEVEALEFPEEYPLKYR
jgi:hypothetical protein